MGYRGGMRGIGMAITSLLLFVGTPSAEPTAVHGTILAGSTAVYGTVLAESTEGQPIHVGAEPTTKPSAKSGVYEFSQVYFRYIPEENFMRISEFFDGEENPGVRKLIRSVPEQRSGFYFILRLEPGWKTLQEGSQLRVHYVPLDAIHPIVYDFDLGEEVRSWNGEIFFGLTGEQWSQEGGEPIAWKLQLLSPAGKVMAVRDSFLWKDRPVRSGDSE